MLLEGAPGPRQDAARAHARALPRSAVLAHPVHARPDAERRRGHQRARHGRCAARRGLDVPAAAGPDLRTARAGRRDQPRHAQDAERAARGDGRARGDHRGQRHALEEPFFVLATENPIEMEGTYPLPEAQLDRFLLKVVVPNPSEDELCDVLGRTTGRAPPPPPQVIDRDAVLGLRELCRDVAVAEPIVRYAARLVRASDPSTAEAPEVGEARAPLRRGVRGGQSLVLAAKAVALCEGRANVSFDDVKRVAKPALRHRLIRSFDGEAEGITTDAVVDALLAAVPTRPASVEAERPRAEVRRP